MVMKEIESIYKELEEIASKKVALENRLMEAIVRVVKDESKDSPRIVKRMSPNSFVVNSSSLIGETWSPTYYDYAKASEIIVAFVKKCGVAECKAKLKEMLDKCDNGIVYFSASSKPKSEGGYKNAVDAKLIKSIIEKL